MSDEVLSEEQEDLLETKKERIDYFRNKNLLERARELLSLFMGAKKNLSIYPPHHTVCVESIVAFFGGYREYFQLADEFQLRIVGEELFFEEKLLARESVLHYSLVKDCKERGVGGISLLRGLAPEELADFLYLLNLDPRELEKRGGLRSQLGKRDIVHITVADPGTYEEIKKEERKRVSEREEYFSAVDAIRELADDAVSGKRIKANKANKVVGSILNRVVENRSAILGLATIKSYDEYTSFHSVNVLILSLALGSMLPLDRQCMMILGTGALLHDIGKVTIPQSVITKQGPLSGAEWDLMREHPVIGADILVNQPGLNPLSVIIAFEHHMRYDLKGYPEVPEMNSLSLFSRIVEIADVYDAMTTDRPYQKAKDPQQAMRILAKDAGSAFDPLLVKVFIDMMGFYPVGTLVRTATGETGIVYEQTEGDNSAPLVKIIRGSSGEAVEPHIVDLTLLKEKVLETGRAVIESVNLAEAGIDVSEYL